MSSPRPVTGPGADGRREVEIEGPAGSLEGLLEYPEDVPVGVVVVAHPHPLYGGSMVQPMVHHVARSCRRHGLATLRFNFRGVGRSGGGYSGIDEYKDVRAAAAFARSEFPGIPVSLAGYSFGSVMAALAVADGEAARALALVALAVRWEEFMPSFLDGIARFPGPVLSVCAELDDIAPPAEVTHVLVAAGLAPQTVVIPGADHFFVGSQDEAAMAVAGFVRDASLEPTPGRV